MTLTRSALVLALSFSLASCGVTYVSSQVSDRAAGLDVRVIPISAETVLVANRQAYAPRSLPEAFFQAAGSGGSAHSMGALPDAPTYPQMSPGVLELRPPPQVPQSSYRLGVGDVLRMSIANGQEVDAITGQTKGQTTQQELTVRDDGAVSIPQVGSVEIAGLTIADAEARLFERMIDAGLDPRFSLDISGFNSRRASIGGAVRSPMVLPLSLPPTTLAQAVAASGGITARDQEFASIRIYREGELYQIPLKDYLSRANLQQLTLAPGDAVYVDTSYDLERAQAYYEGQLGVIALRRADRQAALAELQSQIGLRRAALEEQRSNYLAREELGATERDYVYLTGEVAKQSRWALPFGQQASLADVLYGSGGFSSETGNPAHIYVLRASTDPAAFGAVTAWHFDARNAAMFTLAPKFEMRPDDIVFIEEQPITRWNRAIRQSVPSLISSVGALTN